MAKETKIVVVGSFNVDVTSYAPRLPRHGETVIGSSVTLGCGGKGYNQAVGAARAGAQVCMVTKIGDDALSAFAHEHFALEGMTEKYVSRAQGMSTGAAFIEVDEATGENRIIIVKSANACLTKEDVEMARADIATCGAALVQLETSMESVQALITLAKAHGKPVVLNPAPFQALPDGLLREIDYITPNETEAEFYTGIKVEDEKSAARAAARLMELGAKNAVLTLGKRGAYYKTAREEGLVPAPIVKAVDTTGAGDAFNGAFTVALAEGRRIAECVRFANCFAALSVTRRGTGDAMPHRAQADELYNAFARGI